MLKRSLFGFMVACATFAWSTPALAAESEKRGCKGAALGKLAQYVNEYDGQIDFNDGGDVTAISLPMLRVSGDQLDLVLHSRVVVDLNLSTEYFTIGQLPDEMASCIGALPTLESLHLSGHTLDDSAMAGVGDQVQLKSLNLSGVPISGSGLVHLGTLKNLTRLHLGQLPFQRSYRHYFRGFDVADEGLKQLKNLKSLDTLSLFGSQITDRAIQTINEFSHLKSLNLGLTNITTKGLERLNLSHLEVLILDGSRVNSLPDNLKSNRRLRELGLRHITLRDEDFSRIGKFTNLSKLWLSDTGLVDGQLGYFASQQLIALDVGGNRLGVEGVRELAKHKSLEELHIDRNPVDDRAFNALSNLTQLSVLSLNETMVTDEISGLFGKLPHLVALDLSKTGISDKTVSILGQHSKLEKLRVSETQVTDLGLQKLSSPQLVEVNISGTLVTETGLDKWKPSSKLRSLTAGELSSEKGLSFVNLGNHRDVETVSFSYSGIRSDGLDGVKMSDSLRELGATGVASLTDDHIKRLRGLTKVHTLELSGTSITDASIDLLSGYDRMHCFDLAGTDVSAEALHGLAKMDNVHSLALDGDQVQAGGIDIAHQSMSMFFELYLVGPGITDELLAKNIKALEGIREIIFYGTKVSDDGLQLLASLPNLHTVRVAGGPATRNGLMALRAESPDTAVVLNEGALWWYEGVAGKSIRLKRMP